MAICAISLRLTENLFADGRMSLLTPPRTASDTQPVDAAPKCELEVCPEAVLKARQVDVIAKRVLSLEAGEAQRPSAPSRGSSAAQLGSKARLKALTKTNSVTVTEWQCLERLGQLRIVAIQRG